mgnify:FL=1
MNDNMIHELVENSIKNSDRDQFNQVVSFSNPREEYIYNSAKRLVNMWFNFQSEDIYRVDFECSLRNYLLLVKKSITIHGYKPSNKFTELGLQYDANTGKIWTSLIIPSFFNKELVKQLYMLSLIHI